MSDQELMERFLAIGERLKLSDTQVAVASGLAPYTVRMMRVGKTLPRQARCLSLITEFILRNRHAKQRGEVRLAP